MKIIKPLRPIAKNVTCFSTTVTGGVSKGVYESLNLAYHVKDLQGNVNQNRQRIDDFLVGINSGTLPALYMNQQHTADVCDLDRYSLKDCLPVDGICTSKVLLPLAVMTADCLPIVMTDGNRVSAVHAGWRGLIDNILVNAVSTFGLNSSISAWIGPSISCSNFEVGEDVAQLFKSFQEYLYPAASKGKYLIDLKMVCREQLMALGVKKIEMSNECTYSDTRFFSHRRAIHAGLENTGRNATFILKIV